jgi:hypothetical protein
MNAPLVTVGVPVYGGRETLPILLECLRTQSYRNLDVLVSADAGDRASAAACEPFLRDDPRFRIQVQPSRLGWAGNTDWTMRNRRGAFYIYQQHDDLVSPTYVADLVAAAQRWPAASLCFSTLRYAGERGWDVTAPSIVGNPVARALSYLRRLDWVPFRGLIRSDALDRTAGLLLSDFDPFDSLGTEIRLMTELVLLGEFRFVEGPLYFKSWDGKNLSAKRSGWSREHRLRATACWAAWMVEAIAPAGPSVDERRHLFRKTLERFVRPYGTMRWVATILLQEALAGAPARTIRSQLKRRPPPPGLGRISATERSFLVGEIYDRLKRDRRFDVMCLGMNWDELQARLRARYGMGGRDA